MAIGQGFTGGLNTIGNWNGGQTMNMPMTGAINPAAFPSGNNQPFATNAALDPWQQAATMNAQGNLYGAQQATQANRVNQTTPYGSLNYSQSTDQFGNPVWSANQTLSPELQNLVGGSLGNLQSSLNTPAYGVNAGETATDAIMRRLRPEMQNQSESFDVKMANQGIPVGSEAYNRAYRNFSQGQNDLLTSAQTAGINTGLAVNQAQNTTAANIKALSTPNYVNPYTQAAVAGPDYLGAAGLSNQNAIGSQNAATAGRSNLTSGLMNLAGTAALAYGLSR
jgi:hypothetical protein